MAGGFQRSVIGLLGLVLCTGALFAQSRNPDDLAAGKLLVAPKDYTDPNFAKSVILLIDYDENGALGLMINRQTKVPVSRVLSEVKGADSYSGSAYLGGPVSLEAVLALLKSHSDTHAGEQVISDLYFITKKSDLESALASDRGAGNLHIYLGYCGWGPGQLDNEVRRGDWHIVDATAQIVFDSEPSTLWSRMIARTETRTARLLRSIQTAR